MQFELTISPAYVSNCNWGTWEALREFLQNTIDGDQAGYPMDIKYDPANECLKLYNKGAELKPEHLILGVTSKSEGQFRGKFGEGFKLGMLVFCRQAMDNNYKGCPIEIQTGKQIWRPSIKYSNTFKTDLMIVDVSTGRECNGVQVTINNISLADWMDLKTKILSLHKEYKKISTDSGDILTDPLHKGQLYVKDLWVSKLPEDSPYGYNLGSAELDRDRRMADTYSVRAAVAHIIEMAALEGHFNNKQLLALFEANDSLEARGFAWRATTTKFKELVTKAWQAENGEKTIPVTAISEASVINSYGLSAKVTTSVMVNIIGQFTGTLEKLQVENILAIKRIVPSEELPTATNIYIRDVCHRFSTILEHEINVTIVEFKNPNIHGTCRADGYIAISVDALTSKVYFINVLIHELGHLKGDKDLTAAHMNEVTSISAKLLASFME